ncbi:MAG: hypothetical protein JWS12_528 [Candidatus Saccharibacteria bacterium]|nr:hypothetical protein [Candidatus Saccharibacteria bacterium]
MKQKVSARARQAHTRQKKIVRANRPYHKRLLLSPISVFFLLCVGVLLIGVTYQALAADVTVVAQKPAPLPTSPAVIELLTPQNQAGDSQAPQAVASSPKTYQVDRQIITLSGSCPKDSYLKFYRNDLFAGVTMCIGDPVFSIEISLVDGLNKIEAHVFSLTDGEGPLSLPFYINYTRPSLAAPAAKGPTKSPTIVVPLAGSFLLTSNYRFRGVFVNQAFNWDVDIHGGTPPYKFDVDWGDRSSSNSTHPSVSNLVLAHTYSKPGGYNGNYAIKVHATDSKAVLASMQLMAVVNNKPKPNVLLDTTCASPAIGFGCASWLPSVRHWLWAVWPTYSVVLLMALSFWLGERQEIRQLLLPKRRIQHRRP